jgi:hypothetical protein
MLIGDDDQLQELMAGGDFDGLALHLTRLLASPPGLDELVMAHDFHNAMINGIDKLKKPARRGIGKLDQSLGISKQNTVRDLVKDSGKARAF